jgi:hypothetical protein
MTVRLLREHLLAVAAGFLLFFGGIAAVAAVTRRLWIVKSLRRVNEHLLDASDRCIRREIARLEDEWVL